MKNDFNHLTELKTTKHKDIDPVPDLTIGLGKKKETINSKDFMPKCNSKCSDV